VRIKGISEDTVVELSIDKKLVKAGGSAVPRSVNPGTRAIEARATGYKPAATKVTLAEGEKREVTLTLQRAPGTAIVTPPTPPTPEPKKDDEGGGFPIAATLGFGLGAAGLVVGGVTGGLSLAKASDLDDMCNDEKVCPPEAQDTLDDAELLANVSNVAFGVAGAAIVFGVIALFTIDAPSKDEARIRQHVTATRDGILVRF
jgi:hypothetical protein